MTSIFFSVFVSLFSLFIQLSSILYSSLSVSLVNAPRFIDLRFCFSFVPISFEASADLGPRANLHTGSTSCACAHVLPRTRRGLARSGRRGIARMGIGASFTTGIGASFTTASRVGG